MKKNVLITGVAGFIGSNLADMLLKKNFNVIGIDNLSYGVLEQIPKGPRSLIIQALEFPEMSAGRLMQRDYVAVQRYWNVGQVIDFLRGSVKVPDQFYSTNFIYNNSWKFFLSYFNILYKQIYP